MLAWGSRDMAAVVGTGTPFLYDLFIVTYAVHPGSASKINLAYKLVNASFLWGT